MSKLWRKGEIGALGLSTQLFLEHVEAIAQDNLSGYLRSRFMQLDLRALSPGFSGLPVIAAHQSMVE